MANRSPDKIDAPKRHGVTHIWTSDKPIQNIENWSREKISDYVAKRNCYAARIAAFPSADLKHVNMGILLTHHVKELSNFTCLMLSNMKTTS